MDVHLNFIIELAYSKCSARPTCCSPICSNSFRPGITAVAYQQEKGRQGPQDIGLLSCRWQRVSLLYPLTLDRLRDVSSQRSDPLVTSEYNEIKTAIKMEHHSAPFIHGFLSYFPITVNFFASEKSHRMERPFRYRW